MPPLGGRGAVLYVRVSAVMGRAGEEFLSPEMQEAAMRRLCEARGLREVAVVPDIDQSGRTFDRAGLDRIRVMAQAREFDVLVVNDLTRLGRNAGEAMRFIAWLREHGVEVASTKENVEDVTPAGKLNTGLALLLAEMYSDQIALKWREVIEHRARNGKAHGRPPIGYLREVDMDATPGRFGRRPSRIVVDPILGPIMSEIFRDYAAGRPIGELVQRLAVRGKPVGLTHLRRMLAHPFYLGKVVLWQRPQNAAKAAASEAPVIAEGAHPALVDEATFRRVQRRLRADSGTYERRHLAMEWSLAGLAVCAACGYPLAIKSNKPHTRLRCNSGRRVNPTGCAGCGAPRLDRVEEAVLARLADGVAKLRAAPVAEPTLAVSLAAQRQAISGDLAANRAAQAKLVAGWSTGKVPDHAYETNLADLLGEEQRLRYRLDDLDDQDDPVEPDVAADLGDEVLELWPEALPTERRILLATAVVRVRVRAPAFTREPYPERVEVDFRW